MGRFLAVVGFFAIFTTAPGLVAPAWADHCDKRDRNCVHTAGNDEQDAIVTDGVNFPGVDPVSGVGQATKKYAQCKNCEWGTVPACMTNGPSAGQMACMGATVGCVQNNAIRYLVYMRRGSGPWQLQGTVCLGPGERPATVADVGQAIRTQVVNFLPDAHPAFQPRAGGIVNLPTIFAAGEPGAITTEPFDVLGFTVVVTARARWEWAFAPGVVKGFEEPGGVYPDTSVAYTYRRPGDREVSVTTYWRAEFSVDGQGPFTVPGGEISKTAGPFAVPVREARAELIGG